MMKRLARLAPPAALVAAGLVAGAALATPLGRVTAQDADAKPPAATVEISEADAEKVKLATDAIATAQAALEQDGAYRPAIRGLNAYAVLAGGVDALADLEDARGVDPITYAGLHTGLEVDEVTPHLAKDSSGRLTYKGKLVRMYAPERMKEMIDRQAAVLAVTAGGRTGGAAGEP